MAFTADTVVLTHPPLGLSSIPYEHDSPVAQDILEKPASKEDNLRMLLDLNGGVCEVVTGVSVGVSSLRYYVQSARINFVPTQCIPYWRPRDTRLSESLPSPREYVC